MKHFVGRKQEVAELGKLRVVVEGVPILLVWADHQVYAIGDKCPHMGASLEKGIYRRRNCHV
jgi:nitrite reductase/ring-hydroxylating ferredoxin subunit